MLSCFNNFIGIDKTITPNASSGLYLTTLGFKLRTMKSIADLPLQDATNFANEMIERAALYCTSDLLHKIPSVLFNGILDNVIMPNFTDTYQDYFVGERGVVVKKYSNDRYPLRGFRISKIYVKGNDTVSGKTVRIIDGTNIINFPVNLIAGETAVIDNVNYVVKNEKFSIVMDFSDVRGANPTTFLSYCDSCNNWNNIDKFGVQSGYGIAANFTYECSEEKIICNILHTIKYAILYRAGIETLLEMEASDRVNFFVIHKSGWAEKNMKIWGDSYESELKKKLSSISNNVRNIDNCCFSNKRYELVNQEP